MNEGIGSLLQMFNKPLEANQVQNKDFFFMNWSQLNRNW